MRTTCVRTCYKIPPRFSYLNTILTTPAHSHPHPHTPCLRYVVGGAVWVTVKDEWFPLLHPNWTVIVGWLVLCVLLWMGRNATLLYIVLATSRESFTKDVDVRGTIERASHTPPEMPSQHVSIL